MTLFLSRVCFCLNAILSLDLKHQDAKKNEKGQTILTVVGKIKDVNNLLLNNMTTAFIQHSTQTDFKRKKKRKQTF